MIRSYEMECSNSVLNVKTLSYRGQESVITYASLYS